MSPTYTVSPNATGAPVSGTSRNFSSPVAYTITAQDLSTKDYTVTVTPLAPPAAPTNLAATAGSNTVALTWTAASGASGYKVKRATTSGGPYTTIGTPGGASYSDTTAINGTTYYYVVTATNGGGESANSSQVSATPSLLTTTTTLASSLGATGTYGSVTFTATVTAGATGTVKFRDGTTVLDSVPLASGQAAYPISTLAAGSHSLTATYEGDTTYAPSASAPFSYVVSAKSVTVTGVTAADKVYDGTTAAAALSDGMVSGTINGDIVSVVAGTGSFANADAGTWAVTATGYALGGTHAANYVLSAQPAVPNASITARPLQLTGNRVYDGTVLAAAASLTIGNQLGGDDLTLTGNANLAGKDVGTQAIDASTATPARVGSAATGSTAAAAAASFDVAVAAPAAGNTLIAVITTRGNASGRVSSIIQPGVSNWIKAPGAEGVNTAASNSSTTEIWFASNVPAGAGTTVTINLATPLFASAVVTEYSGVLTTSPLDKTAGSNGNSAAATTGATVTTVQANELWIGGIGLNSSTPTLGTPLNAFTASASAQSSNATAASNAKVDGPGENFRRHRDRLIRRHPRGGGGGNRPARQRYDGQQHRHNLDDQQARRRDRGRRDDRDRGSTRQHHHRSRSDWLDFDRWQKSWGDHSAPWGCVIQGGRWLGGHKLWIHSGQRCKLRCR